MIDERMVVLLITIVFGAAVMEALIYLGKIILKKVFDKKPVLKTIYDLVVIAIVLGVATWITW